MRGLKRLNIFSHVSMYDGQLKKLFGKPAEPSAIQRKEILKIRKPTKSYTFYYPPSEFSQYPFTTILKTI